MKKIAAFFFLFFLAFSTFAKEKVLKEKNYPNWIKDVISPTENSDWKGWTFVKHEMLDKVAEDNDKIIIYSKDDNYSYRIVCDKNGNLISEEAYYLSDGSFALFIECYDKPPYNKKYLKNKTEEYWYDEDKNIIHGKDDSDEWWNTYQDGRLVCKKYADGRECWYDEEENESWSQNGKLVYAKTTDGVENWFDEDGNVIHGKNDSEEWWSTFQNGKLVYQKSSDGVENWYDEDGNMIHGKDDSEEWWNTFQNGKLIYQKSVFHGEKYWDYDKDGNVSLEKYYLDGSFYICEYRYDSRKRVVYRKTRKLDKDENTVSSITEEMSYNGDDDFVSSVKWTMSGPGWDTGINGYELNNIENGLEYKFEKLSENQMKVIPQNGKHWFVVEKNE